MDLLEVFRDSDDLMELSSGSVLFEEGDTAEFMYVIVEGEVRLTLHGTEIASVSEGAIVGEMALLDRDARSATATAVTDCRLALIDLHSFKSLIQHTPDFALHVMNVLADRLRATSEALTERIPIN